MEDMRLNTTNMVDLINPIVWRSGTQYLSTKLDCLTGLMQQAYKDDNKQFLYKLSASAVHVDGGGGGGGGGGLKLNNRGKVMNTLFQAIFCNIIVGRQELC